MNTIKVHGIYFEDKNKKHETHDIVMSIMAGMNLVRDTLRCTTTHRGKARAAFGVGGVSVRAGAPPIRHSKMRE